MEAGSQRLRGPDINVSQITKLQITITLQSRRENGKLLDLRDRDCDWWGAENTIYNILCIV